MLLKDGRFYIVQTVLNGDLYLRVSLRNPWGSYSDVFDINHKDYKNALDRGYI